MGISAQVSRYLRLPDLRFEDAPEEEAFHLSRERNTVVSLQIGGFCIIISLAVILSSRSEIFETENVPPEFVAPRRLFLIGAFGSMFIEGTLLVLTFIYRVGPVFRGWWEDLITLHSIGYFFVANWLLTPWFIAQYYGVDAEELWVKESRHSASLTVLGHMVFIVAVCFTGAIRSHKLILLPVCLVVAHGSLIMTFESPFPDGSLLSLLYLVFLCGFSFYGAWRHEGHIRKEWRACRKVVEQEAQVEEITLINQAFAAMAGTTSDLVLVLDSDLRIIPNKDVRAHEAYFGRSLGNLVFHHLLSEDIKERFLQLLEEAETTDLLLSMPAEVELRWGVAGAQLVLIHTKSQSHARYLVGIHFNDPTPIQEAELRNNLPLLEGPVQLPTVLESALSQQEDDTTFLKENNHRLESVVSTTYTGQAFEDVDAVPDGKSPSQTGGNTSLKAALQRIARIGIAEHWLVPPDEVEILPDKVLGKGGFSQVILARLRGSPVAAKVPRRSETVNMSMLNALVNEIRVLRHLRHTNIALFYGASIDPATGNLALLYEVVSGQNGTMYVRTVLSKLKGSWQKVCQTKLLLDVASALHYLHNLSPAIVHGDVKGDNVMVETRRGCPHGKLMDFGLSRIRTKHPRSLGGTRYWIAPELVMPVEARPKPLPSSDVYSFGWLIYFVSTFTPPSAALDPKTKALPVGNLRLLWPCEDVREYVEPLVNGCLRLEYAERPTMKQLINSLLSWLPEDQDTLAQLGLPVIMLFLDGWEPWDGGLVAPPADDADRARPISHNRQPATPSIGDPVGDGQKATRTAAGRDEGEERGKEEDEEEDDDDDDDGYSGQTGELTVSDPVPPAIANAPAGFQKAAGEKITSL